MPSPPPHAQDSPQDSEFRQRITAAAEQVLKKQTTVGLLDVLVAARFIHWSHVDEWRRGNPAYECIHQHVQCGPPKLKRAVRIFLDWAQARNLAPVEASYTRRSPAGTVALKFTDDGDAATAALYTRHFARAGLSEKQTARVKEKLEKAEDLAVFIAAADNAVCQECREPISRGDYMTLERKEPLCLACADMDHLVFLPAGDVALTRRAKKHSPLSAVVMSFNRRRKRYDREGLLITAAALSQAEDECIADAGERAVRRSAAAAQRGVADAKFTAAFTTSIRAQFPSCPAASAEEIAAHAAVRGSGRVGRSAAGQALDANAVRMAVIAHIRHIHTDYDRLLMQGVERSEARERIRDKVQQVLSRWER